MAQPIPRGNLGREGQSLSKDDWMGLFECKIDHCTGVKEQNKIMDLRGQEVGRGWQSHNQKTAQLFLRGSHIHTVVIEGEHKYLKISSTDLLLV